MKKTLLAALFALTPALFASSAKADVLDFSYTWTNGNVISGTMDGTQLSNGNNFDVSSFGSLFLNGVAVTLPTVVESADERFLHDDTPAEVSVNGSYMDLYAADATDALAFVVGDAASVSHLYGNYAGAYPGYGGTGGLQPYVQSDWLASAGIVPVPEPSSLLLMLAPLALTALLLTSRRTGGRVV